MSSKHMGRASARATLAGLTLLAAAAAGLVAATALPARAAERSYAETASSLQDYRARVVQAGVLARDSAGVATRSQAAGQAVAFRIDELLPAVEMVRVGGRDVTIDNSVMRSLLERLRGSPTPDGRAQAIALLTEHFSSLRAAVGSGDVASLPQDRGALDRLLAGQAANEDPAFGRRVSRFLDGILAAIGKMWGDVTATPGGRFLADALRWLVVGSLALLLVIAFWWVARRIGRAVAAADAATPAGEGAEHSLSDELLPADALAFADELAGGGRFRDAVRALMRGSVRALRHSGLLRRTRARTTGELLGQLAGAPVGVTRPMRSLASGFDRAWYGAHDPGPQGFRDARAQYVSLAGALVEAGGDEAAARPGGRVEGDAEDGDDDRAHRPAAAGRKARS